MMEEQSGAPEGAAGAEEPQAEGGATDDDSKTRESHAADAPEPRPVPDELLAALETLEKDHSGEFVKACAEHGLDNLELSGVSDIPEGKREAVWNSVMDALEASSEPKEGP